MSDLQLERSVLEGKEREELFAIAQALGSSPPARTKKADLVSHILQATGVEEAVAPDKAATSEKTRKPRARRTSSKGAGADAPEQLALDAVEGEEDQGAPALPVAPTAAAPSRLGVQGGSAGEPGPERASEDLSPSFEGEPSANGHSQPGTNGRGERSNGSTQVVQEGLAASGTPAERPNGRANGRSGDEAPARPAQAQVADGLASDGQVGYAPQPYQRSDYNRGRADSEAGVGNSRRRRRRNRDKPSRGEVRGPERDLVAQPEVPYSGELVACSGLLDLREEGYGFLRTSGYLASSSDIYVSITQVRRFGLRKGDLVEGAYRPAASNEKYPALVRVDSVCGLSPDEARNRPKFESLTPLFPDEKLSLEVPGDPANVTARIVDLISPIGKGQRGLIVSPPKAGKTTVLKQIAHSIEANNPEVYLMVLLVDERPEEVTDMRRSVKGEVVASTFDRPSDEHTQVAELAIERAKRMVELGRDVVIVLDGITRLARAYNLAQPATGRIMSGGIDTGALYPPKKFFGSARNIEEGGSLTILATALVETGSRMDEVIFEEFKGTGNMELRLDRKLAERRVYPALDVNASSTRHEELLFDRGQLQQVWKLRRVLNALGADGNPGAGLELLVDKIRTTRSNEQFLADIAKQPAPAI
ncbi:MAG: transcription termination factor Rho [Actinobacteria bacterium]|nr:transcription termination factor Rho [Actinomycetota bacterium]